MEETKMNKTIIAILMVALMIVPMIAFAEAKGPAEGVGDQPNTTQPEPPVFGGYGNGTINMSQDRDTLRQQIRDCLEDESSDCSAVREMGKAFASGVIDKFCGNAEQKMEQMRTRTENAQGLTDEEKELFMKTIRTEEEKLTQACNAFENGPKDKEAIKESAEELRTIARETTVKSILAKEKIQEQRVGLVLQRAGQLDVKLERIQAKLNNSNGTNENCSQEMEQLRNQFREQINGASGLYNESAQIRERLVNGQGSGNFTEDLRQGQEKMQQAQAKLQEAHQTLKQITTQLRQCAVNVSDEEENETED